jgi:hypothetical protein
MAERVAKQREQIKQRLGELTLPSLLSLAPKLCAEAD